MADRTKIVAAGVYPKPGRLQEVIDVYAGMVPLVHQEPGCELFALHTDGETVFLVEKWATPADLQAHAAGPAYAQIAEIHTGVSDLVDHAADVAHFSTTKTVSPSVCKANSSHPGSWCTSGTMGAYTSITSCR